VIDDILATLAFGLIALGWTQRRRRSRHVPLVLAGIGLDLALVVYLEATMQVVQRVAGTVEHLPYPTVRWAHIASSTLAVVLYLPTMWFGFRMLRGATDAATKKRHAVFATLALLSRTIGFLCMWAVEATKA
jgi:hypothetical protein